MTDNAELQKVLERIYPGLQLEVPKILIFLIGRILEAQIAVDLRDMSNLISEREKLEKKVFQLRTYYDSVNNPEKVNLERKSSIEFSRFHYLVLQ